VIRGRYQRTKFPPLWARLCMREPGGSAHSSSS